jgi:hypothetical protein
MWTIKEHKVLTVSLKGLEGALDDLEISLQNKQEFAILGIISLFKSESEPLHLLI